VGDEGAKLLASLLASGVPLAEVDLHANGIGDEGAAALAAAIAGGGRAAAGGGSGGSSLAKLDLGGNAIGDAGARALCRALLQDQSLAFLSLQGNRCVRVCVCGLSGGGVWVCVWGLIWAY
jgi:hypothetical protein